MTFLTTDIVARGNGFNGFSDLIYVVLVVLLPALAGLGKWLRRRFGTADDTERASPPETAEKAPQRPTVPKPLRPPPTVVGQGPPPSARPVPGRAPQTRPRQQVPGIRVVDTMADAAQPVDLEHPQPRHPEHLQPSDVRAASPPHLPRRQVPGTQGSEPPRAGPQPPRQGAARTPRPGKHPARSARPARHQPKKARPAKRAAPATARAESKPGGPIQATVFSTAGKASGKVPVIPPELTADDLRSVVILSEILRPPLALRSIDDWSG